MSIKVFISHATKDEALARRLVQVIEAGIEIKPSQIRCTSVEGYKLQTGVTTSKHLRKDLRESQVVLGLVTPNSLKSNYVLFELGAAWGLKKPTFPLLARGAKADNLPGPLQGSHASRLTQQSEVVQMVQDLVKRGGQSPKVEENRPLLTAQIERLAKRAKSQKKKKKGKKKKKKS